MSFYERYQKAWDEQDISAMLDLYHPDYKRVFHAKGIDQGAFKKSWKFWFDVVSPTKSGHEIMIDNLEDFSKLLNRLY